jgi:hypothetical protein
MSVVDDDCSSCCSDETQSSEYYDIWGSSPGGAPKTVRGAVLTKALGRLRPWHHRYITIESGVLRYYKFSGAARPRRVYNMHSDRVEFSYDQETKTLKLHFPVMGRTIKFRPDFEEAGPSYLAWKDAVLDHLRFAEVMRDDQESVKSMRSEELMVSGLSTFVFETPEHTEEPPPMSSCLEKRSRALFRMWQLRHCTLERGIFVYKHSPDGPPRGHINFHKVDAEFCCDTAKGIIRITVPHRVYQFRMCTSDTSMDVLTWKRAFIEHITFGKQCRRRAASFQESSGSASFELSGL